MRSELNLRSFFVSASATSIDFFYIVRDEDVKIVGMDMLVVGYFAQRQPEIEGFALGEHFARHVLELGLAGEGHFPEIGDPGHASERRVIWDGMMVFDLDFHRDAPNGWVDDPNRAADRLIDDRGDHSAMDPLRIRLMEAFEGEQGDEGFVFHLIEGSFQAFGVIDAADEAHFGIGLFFDDFHNFAFLKILGALDDAF